VALPRVKGTLAGPILEIVEALRRVARAVDVRRSIDMLNYS